MKKLVHLSLGLLFAGCIGTAYSAGVAVHEGDVTARSYYRTPGFFESGMVLRESMFGNKRMDSRKDGFGGALQVVTFASKTSSSDCSKKSCNTTSKNMNNWGKYFFGKHELLVAGDASPSAALRDIDPRHFNLETENNTFESKISVAPEQSVFGVGFAWKHALCYDDNNMAKWWFELSAPLVRVENKLNFKESIIEADGGAVDQVGLDEARRVGSMKEAFAQASWKAGRIVDAALNKKKCEMSETKIADMEVKIGYTSCPAQDCYLGSYVGMVIPTGTEVGEGDYKDRLFQPVVGNGRHFGLMWGSQLQMHVREWENSSLKTRLDLNSRYLFSKRQRRSFDLNNKPLSRYMEMYATKEAAQAAAQAGIVDAGVSGINIMTQCVDVTPRFSGHVNTALIYQRCNWIAEFGWGLHAAQEEKIELEKWSGTAALKAFDGVGNTVGMSTRDNKGADRNLAYQSGPDTAVPALENAVLVANYDNNTIKASELNLGSAAHPATLYHSLYGSVAYEWGENNYPTVLAVGGSYDFATTNVAPDRWALWLKLGVSF